MDPVAFRYCPRYCEENIWHLAQDPVFSGCATTVALISNAAGACLFWDQQICPEPDLPVWWDYHVILLSRKDRWLVYDLDTALPLPVDAGTYLFRTFRFQDRMPVAFRPRFMLFDGGEYVETFASDRSHMRDEDGGWLSPPPEWPAIRPECGEGFATFIAQQIAAGEGVSIETMCGRFGG